MRADPAWRWTAISDDAPAVRKSRLGRVALWTILGLLLLPVPFVAAYQFLPVPATPLMFLREAEGEPMVKHWVPLTRISPAVVRAVVSSEDEKFCRHHGFDWVQLAEAWRDYRAGKGMRGASTISMQTAKNLFLWPDRSIVRKGIEAYLTALIEFAWSKQRIMEVYLNVIEWGHGIYGIEAAARAYFNKPAVSLSSREAALLAAVLPNPRRLSVASPTPYIEGRVNSILQRMPMVDAPSPYGCR